MVSFVFIKRPSTQTKYFSICFTLMHCAMIVGLTHFGSVVFSKLNEMRSLNASVSDDWFEGGGK